MGGGDCFIKDTKIETLEGHVLIQDVMIGDRVLTYSVEEGKIQAQEVHGLMTQFHTGEDDDFMVKVRFDNGVENVNTNTHPYYIKGIGWASWVPEETKRRYDLDVSQLQVGDTALYFDGEGVSETKITGIMEDRNPVITFNLSKVVSNHNFFANSILVHNKGGGGEGGGGTAGAFGGTPGGSQGDPGGGMAGGAGDVSGTGNVASAPNVGNTAAMANQGHVGPDPGSTGTDAQGNDTGDSIGFGGNIGAEGMSAEGVAPGTSATLGFSTSHAKAGFAVGNALTGNPIGAGIVGIGAGVLGGSSMGTPDSSMGMDAEGNVGLGQGSTSSDGHGGGPDGADTGFGGNVGDPAGAGGGGVGPGDIGFGHRNDDDGRGGFAGIGGGGRIDSPPVVREPPPIVIEPEPLEPPVELGEGRQEIKEQYDERFGHFDVRQFDDETLPSIFVPELIGVDEDEEDEIYL